MIDSYMATKILVAFVLLFGVVIPILDKVPFVKNFISFRWSIIVVYLALCIGVIIDFEHLDTSVRLAVIIGGVLLSAIFLFVRSLEKAAINRWKFPRFRGRVKRGDFSGEVSVSPKIDDNSRLKELSSFVEAQKEEDYDTVMNNAQLFGLNKKKEEKQ